MKCPYCSSSEMKVVDKRNSIEAIRRRRECLKCSKRFTTYEKVELVDLNVVKKNGKIEPFQREKLRKGILTACEKRPVTEEGINCMCDRIEMQLRRRKKIEVPSKIIGELVIKKLQNIDKIAYLRFASVYKQFSDLSHFQKELNVLKGEKQ